VISSKREQFIKVLLDILFSDSGNLIFCNLEHCSNVLEGNSRCSALETILCPDETPATLGKGAFPVADGWTVTNASYRIYVPDEQVETYRQAWPDYWAAPNNFQITKVIYGISSMPTQ